MRPPRRRRRRCLSSLLFIPYLKFPLIIRIYHSAPRAMKRGPCITQNNNNNNNNNNNSNGNNNNLLLIRRKYLCEYIQMRLTSYINVIIK